MELANRTGGVNYYDLLNQLWKITLPMRFFIIYLNSRNAILFPQTPLIMFCQEGIGEKFNKVRLKYQELFN